MSLRLASLSNSVLSRNAGSNGLSDNRVFPEVTETEKNF